MKTRDDASRSKIRMMAIADLKPYQKNARTHTGAQIQQIVESVREFGWTNPILIDEGKNLIAGHGRIEAARILGMEKVPCIELTGLSEKQKRAYMIADNKIPLNAGWDSALLAMEISDLEKMEFDVSLLGFGDGELEKIFETRDAPAELPKAIQLEPAREYAVLLCENLDEWERLKVALSLTPVRRGGYRRGSQFDAIGTQRVVPAARILNLLEKKEC